jgi:hypothetical protein
MACFLTSLNLDTELANDVRRATHANFAEPPTQKRIDDRALAHFHISYEGNLDFKGSFLFPVSSLRSFMLIASTGLAGQQPKRFYFCELADTVAMIPVR